MLHEKFIAVLSYKYMTTPPHPNRPIPKKKNLHFPLRKILMKNVETLGRKVPNWSFLKVCWFVEFWRSFQTIEADFLR